VLTFVFLVLLTVDANRHSLVWFKICQYLSLFRILRPFLILMRIKQFKQLFQNLL